MKQIALKITLLLLITIVHLARSVSIEQTKSEEDRSDNIDTRRDAGNDKLEFCFKTDVFRLGELTSEPLEVVVATFKPFLTLLGLPDDLTNILGFYQNTFTSIILPLLQKVLSLPVALLNQIVPGIGNVLTGLMSVFQSVPKVARDVSVERQSRSLDVCLTVGEYQFGVLGSLYNILAAAFGPMGLVNQYNKGLASNQLGGLELIPGAVSELINTKKYSRRAAEGENMLYQTTLQLAGPLLKNVFVALNQIAGGLPKALEDAWNSTTEKGVIDVGFKVNINEDKVNGLLADLTGKVFGFTVNGQSNVDFSKLLVGK